MAIRPEIGQAEKAAVVRNTIGAMTIVFRNIRFITFVSEKPV